jgi:hypothetical protein
MLGWSSDLKPLLTFLVFVDTPTLNLTIIKTVTITIALPLTLILTLTTAQSNPEEAQLEEAAERSSPRETEKQIRGWPHRIGPIFALHPQETLG